MLRWMAVISFGLAIACRLAGRRIPIDIAVPVSTGMHRGVPLGQVLFWGLLAMAAVLALSSIRDGQPAIR